jgi:ATP/ADP translocase
LEVQKYKSYNGEINTIGVGKYLPGAQYMFIIQILKDIMKIIKYHLVMGAAFCGHPMLL